MTKWKLYEIGNVVTSFLKSCDEDMKTAIEERMDLLSELGNMCRMPVSEPLKDGLFALRIKENRQQVRFLYCFKPNGVIIFLHAFYKTTKKLMQKDKDIALENKKSLEKGEIYYGEIDLTY
jgi:phage-related protein